MEGGIGASSYARNSTNQRSAFDCIVPYLESAISSSFSVPLAQGALVCIADLGCATGNNTIDAVSFVVEEIRKKFIHSELEFQALFSDLVSNDFNSLFSLVCDQERGFLIAGVPGSFYHRLFPSSSVHFAMCNVALHWLSKVPDEVMDKNSACWNQGRAWLDAPANPQTVDAYKRQAHEDLCAFLHCRAEEIMPGGLLSVFTNGRSDLVTPLEDDNNFMTWIAGCLQLAWEDMVAEKLIDKGVLDSYNTPAYSRSLDDITKAVEETGGFRVVILEMVHCEMPSYEKAKLQAQGLGISLSEEDYATKEAMVCKSVMKPLVEKHIKDPDLVTAFFERLQARLLPKVKLPGLRYAPMVFTILQRNKH